MPDTSAPPSSRFQVVRHHVTSVVGRLQGEFLNDVPRARADLAKLRRCAPDAAGTDPEVWSITLGGLPLELAGSGDAPSPGERAVHACLVLYAHHQQAHSDPTHRAGPGLGAATRALALARSTDDKLNDSVVQRLHQVGLATDWAGRLHHLRSLIVLMRGESPTIALDYGRLGADLYRLQNPHTASSVLLGWGRDLHRSQKNTTPGEPS